MASFPPPLGSLLFFFKLTASFHFVVVVVVVYMCIFISKYMMCMYGTRMYYSQVNVSSESVFPPFPAVRPSSFLCVETMCEKCLLCNKDLLNTTFISFSIFQ